MGEGAAIPAGERRERLPAIDWLRGLVMVVMAVDHCDEAWNRRHFFGDSAIRPAPRVLPAAEFLTRWCTHVCAPTFVFLAGASIALSAASARRRAASPWSFDRHLLLRGLVLIALEATLVSLYWRTAIGGRALRWWPMFVQVIWALGVGMIALVPLRRLPSAALIALAALLLAASEWASTAWHGSTVSWWQALSLTGGGFFVGEARGFMPDVLVLYPALPWLPAMLLGLLLGRALDGGRRPQKLLVVGGLLSLGLFAVLRGCDGFGNAGLHRRSGDLLEWLHCSKYPPSITYLAMELGLMALLLAGALWLQDRPGRVRRWNPLLVLGQVPLFFYLLHLWLIRLLVKLGVSGHNGVFGHDDEVRWSWLGALVVVLLAWPLCAAYRWYKLRWGHEWTRYL
jgi:uncharacterized membrane protein